MQPFSSPKGGSWSQAFHAETAETGDESATVGNIFTQYNARFKLEYHCSFGLKFYVPVDFLWLRS